MKKKILLQKKMSLFPMLLLSLVNLDVCFPVQHHPLTTKESFIVELDFNAMTRYEFLYALQKAGYAFIEDFEIPTKQKEKMHSRVLVLAQNIYDHNSILDLLERFEIGNWFLYDHLREGSIQQAYLWSLFLLHRIGDVNFLKPTTFQVI